MTNDTVSPTPQTSEHIRAITLHQPWASLCICGAKHTETRSWATSYRGPIAIHAGRLTQGAADDCRDYPYATLLSEYGGYRQIGDLPWGAIGALAELVDCIRMAPEWIAQHRRDDPTDAILGHFAPGRYAWHLANVLPLPAPISCRGQQGLWTPDEDVQRQIRAQLAVRRAPEHDAAVRP